MSAALSPNTQAILLLTAPLIAGRGAPSEDLLSDEDYNRLARHLRDLKLQPLDLLAGDAGAVLDACRALVDPERLRRLLGRGFLLGQMVERWQTRGINVVSRADAAYPRRLKARLREDAPPVLYGCGEFGLVDRGGLAVVGSRTADGAAIDYATAIGGLAAQAGRAVISGGARGIDEAAMLGAIEAGGTVIGVLADGLEQGSLVRAWRNGLRDGRMLLVSPYDPAARFDVGHATRRNRLIYALADAALVVAAEVGKGGSWAGAIEQIERLRLVPVYARSAGARSAGLDALRGKGARDWPEPCDAEALRALLDRAVNASGHEATA